jgi:hypothetical protein
MKRCNWSYTWPILLMTKRRRRPKKIQDEENKKDMP